MGDNPESRAMAYAEQRLQVHDVYDETRSAHADLREAHKALIDHEQQAAGVVESMADREHVLVSAERAANADMSATAFKEHMKEVSQIDPDMKRLRGELASAHREADRAKQAIREAELLIRVGTARMEELGGLLQFYAAVKITRHATDTK